MKTTPSEPKPPGLRPIDPPTRKSVPALHRFVPYRDGAVDVESVVTSCALVGMACFTCVLFASLLDAGLIA